MTTDEQIRNAHALAYDLAMKSNPDIRKYIYLSAFTAAMQPYQPDHRDQQISQWKHRLYYAERRIEGTFAASHPYEEWDVAEAWRGALIADPQCPWCLKRHPTKHLTRDGRNVTTCPGLPLGEYRPSAYVVGANV